MEVACPQHQGDVGTYGNPKLYSRYRVIMEKKWKLLFRENHMETTIEHEVNILLI